MSLGFAMGHPRDTMRANWKLLAFLARYGHQQMDVLMGMPKVDLVHLAGEIGTLIEQEYPGHEGTSMGGG